METQRVDRDDDKTAAIAIVGMSCRVPDAPGLAEFWQNLRDGLESARSFSAEDLAAAGIDPAVMAHPDFVNKGVVLEGVELFDAGFFEFTPRDAEILDPQQRIFLECAWQALEDASCDPATTDGLIGVFGGVDMSSYLFQVYGNPELVQAVGPFPISLANDKDHVTTRVAYKLNLRGPAITVQTTCSTSLVAVCQACQSLLYYQCDVALAGGCAIALPQRVGYLYQEGGIASPDGRCRAFDASAQGTIGGSGCGIVVLKRYEDAVRDRDNIRAIIRGFSVNNDGSSKVGYTAPSVDGQAEVIEMAHAMAGIDPETISYIEAHGTATPLGDPIEVAALTQVFRKKTKKEGFCGIGSVKTNIGHLNSGAGVTSLIKTVLALEHKMLPPSLHYKRPNPNIDFARSPFFVVDRLTEWKNGALPRRAGVSSFGIGGTNAHVIVEEAPEVQASDSKSRWHLLLLSAKTGPALDRATTNLGEHLATTPSLSLDDVVYTLQVGRREHAHRRMLMVPSGGAARAADALRSLDARQLVTAARERPQRPVVFMFPGQGAQYVGMSRQLYDDEPVFRAEIDRCFKLVAPHLGFDLRDVLFDSPASSNEGTEPSESSARAERLAQTIVAQPALFSVEWALAQLWMAWGIRPQALVGHSVGELVAACLAGVFTLEDGLALVAARGRLMQGVAAGSMLAVHAAEGDLVPLLGPELSLAAVNGPSSCVASGPTEAIARLEGALGERRVSSHRLNTSHAFHSWMFDDIVAPFVKAVERTSRRPPKLPYLSNLTGSWITPEMATDATYWGRQLRETVQFWRSLEELGGGRRVLLEIGPGSTLTTLASQVAGSATGLTALPSLPRSQEANADVKTMLSALGHLWISGADVSWKAFNAHRERRRVPLPTYPFERQRYWVERRATPPQASAGAAQVKAPLSRWFYAPDWRPASDAVSPVDASVARLKPLRWLILANETDVRAALTRGLERAGQSVVTVAAGRSFERLDHQSFALNPLERDHHVRLIEELRSGDLMPTRIVHMWGGQQHPFRAENNGSPLPEVGFYSLFWLAQAIATLPSGSGLRLDVVADQMHAVVGREIVDPDKAMLVGACRVIEQELPGIETRCIDIPSQEPIAETSRRLLAELFADRVHPVVAHRNGIRYRLDFRRVELAADGRIARLRPKGVYLITGGLGGIGLALAEHLARKVGARLVLIGRSQVPERDEWQRWLADHGEDDSTSSKIRQVQDLERLGAEVLVASVDVADLEQVRELARRVADRFGPVNGIVHSAGVAGGGIIQLRTLDQVRRVVAPKVAGARVLTDVFAAHRPDFVVLCSSLSAVLGGVGQLDYCAANCYLDAFAHANAFRKAGTMTTSINWDTWADVGMAVNTAVPDDLKRWQAEGLKRGIVRREGMDVFERILSSAHPQVLVSTTNLGERLRQATAPPVRERQEIPVAISAPSHPRPPLDNEYTKPQTGSEERVARLWEELLGIHPVGAQDDFLALGGHSLLAIQLISRLRDSFGVEVSVQAFFENPTVAALAKLVEPRDASQPPSDRRLEAPPLVRVPRDQYRAVRTPEGVQRVPGRTPQES